MDGPDGFIDRDGGVSQLLVDSVVDYAICLLDLDGTIRSWNAGAAHITGYGAEEIVGSNFSRFYTDEDVRAGEPARSLEIARSVGRFEAQGWRVRKDGTRLWADVVIDVVRNPAGEVIGFAKVTRDMTQRALRPVIRDEDGSSKVLVDNILDYAVILLDLDGTVKSWNGGAVRIKGYSAQEIIGRNFSVFYTPDDVSAGEPTRSLEIARKTGRFEGTGWRVRKDGKRVWVNAVIDVVRDPAGVVVGFAKIARDLTQSAALRAVTEENGSIAQTLVDNVVDYAIYLLDLDGTVKSWNAGAQRIKGYSAEEIIGRNFSTFFTDDDVRAGEPVRALATARTTGHFAAEGWRVRKDRTRLWASVVIDAVRDALGEVVGFAKVTRDITQSAAVQYLTEQLRIEREQFLVAKKSSDELAGTLAETNRLMAMAGQMAHVAHWRIDVSANRVIWSDELYRILGWPKSRQPDFESAIETYHPDDRPCVRKSVELALTDGIPMAYEARIAHTDGSYRDVICNGQAERAADGEIVGIVGVFQDVTAAKDAECEREHILMRINVATQAANVGIWEWDMGANLLVWEPLMFALYGVDEAEFSPSYLSWSALVHGDDRERVQRELALAVSGTGVYDTEFRIVWPTGEIRYLRATATVQRESAIAVRMIGANWDITGLRALTRQLEDEKARLLETVDMWTAAKEVADDATRAKSNFLANMSHEIRTPMNGIIGLTSLLLDVDLPPEQEAHLRLIADAGLSLLAIINDILDLSKVEAGRIDLEAIPLSPAGLVQGALALVRGEALKKGLVLESTVAPDVPSWVNGDPTRLRQILLNLLSNALKFTESGRVGVTVRREPQTGSDLLRFEISDTGIGVAAESQHLLFEKFSQVDRSDARKFGGSGLGLAISRRLAEAMCGTIGVTSAVGTGSVFWFTAQLPTTAAPTPLSSFPARRRTDVVARRILLVDDNPLNQIVARAMLEKDGHYVVVVADGLEALAAVQERPFDLVLMDMQMPVMDGMEASRHIRQLDTAVRGIPIVALTANVMPEEIACCREAGMNDHLAKPIDRDLLRQIIATWTTARIQAPASDRGIERS
jgi:PAS domain S-box-containing protein